MVASGACVECEDFVYDNVTSNPSRNYYGIPSKDVAKRLLAVYISTVVNEQRCRSIYYGILSKDVAKRLLAVYISTMVNEQRCRSIYYGILSKDVAKRLLAVNISTMINEQKYRSKNHGIPSKDVAKRLLAGNISTMVTEQNCGSNYWYSLKRRCKATPSVGHISHGKRKKVGPKSPQTSGMMSWKFEILESRRVRFRVRNQV